MYNVILNMYNDVKSCINYNNCKSDYFSCDMGVRQAEKLFVLLYASDTVIIAESRTDLQNQFNIFAEYCQKWKLEVNVEKTKNFTAFYTLNGSEIEIVSEFNYR